MAQSYTTVWDDPSYKAKRATAQWPLPMWLREIRSDRERAYLGTPRRKLVRFDQQLMEFFLDMYNSHSLIVKQKTTDILSEALRCAEEYMRGSEKACE